ncbi:hypothetical protein IW262DRAFT_1415319 [Armillaria fumosa]|nr:hypothetical protein IW262DRAFT_1415319 [Armillaria fumosa]
MFLYVVSALTGRASAAVLALRRSSRYWLSHSRLRGGPLPPLRCCDGTFAATLSLTGYKEDPCCRCCVATEPSLFPCLCLTSTGELLLPLRRCDRLLSCPSFSQLR